MPRYPIQCINLDGLLASNHCYYGQVDVFINLKCYEYYMYYTSIILFEAVYRVVEWCKENHTEIIQWICYHNIYVNIFSRNVVFLNILYQLVVS